MTPRSEHQKEYEDSALRFLDAFSSDEKGSEWPVIHHDKVIPLKRFIEEWKLCRYEALPDITETRPHPAPTDEMEQRFQTKREAWEQGYQDGGSAVQHDLNLVEHEAARKAREEVLKELKEWACKTRSQVAAWNDGCPFIWWYDLRDKIDALRQSSEQVQEQPR